MSMAPPPHALVHEPPRSESFQQPGEPDTAIVVAGQADMADAKIGAQVWFGNLIAAYVYGETAQGDTIVGDYARDTPPAHDPARRVAAGPDP